MKKIFTLTLIFNLIVASLSAQLQTTKYGTQAGALGANNSNFGFQAGKIINISGTYNSNFGTFSGNKITSGDHNTNIGYQAGYVISTGNENTNLGNFSGASNITGHKNVYLGFASGRYNISGGNNTMIGYSSGFNNTGLGNVFLGFNAGYDAAGSNLLYIDNSKTNSPLIWGDFSANKLNFNAKVGIGTPNPSDKLDVNGTARIRSLSSTTTLDRVVMANLSGKLYYRTVSSILSEATDSQNLSLSGNTLALTNGGSVSLSSYVKLTESQVDAYANNNGYYKSGSNATFGTINATGGTSSNWNTAYSQRGSAVAGTGLSWSGGKLNVSTLPSITSSGKISLSGSGTIFEATNTGVQTIKLTNDNIIGVNNIIIADPGVGEGIQWSGTQAKMFVSPLNGGGTDGYLRLINDGGISFEAGVENREDLIIASNGNVGIGINSPEVKLHINGPVRGNQSGALRINSGFGFIDIGAKNTSYAHFQTDRSQFLFNKRIRLAQGMISSHTGHLFLQTVGTTRLTLNKETGEATFTNNVNAKGTKYSGDGKEIIRYSDSWLRINPSNAFTSGIYAGTGLFRTDGAFQIGSGGKRLIVKTNGSVGIGVTTIPSGYKLAVNGGIIAEEINIQLKVDWPDYVFSNDYQLQSLEETEEFISLNKHLYGVPSAQEVEDHGVKLGEMNAILLQKIEELTLHLIDQNKKINTLLDRVVELETKK